MKKFVWMAGLLAATVTQAQTNYTGSYGYSFKPGGDPPKEEKATGPEGSLVLVKMEGNKYRFFLDVNKGWPSYNQGSTIGTLSFKKDTASFTNMQEGAKDPCLLKFRIVKNVIHISTPSDTSDCGYGNGVVAEGKYTKWKVQSRLNNTWLEEVYSQKPKVMVSPGKAVVYKDESALRSSGQSFAKGTVLLSIAETDNAIYTEHFNSAGKFVYGWIKKSAIKSIESE